MGQLLFMLLLLIFLLELFLLQELQIFPDGPIQFTTPTVDLLNKAYYFFRADNTVGWAHFIAVTDFFTWFYSFF